MGKIISVWSPVRRTGKTVFLYILAKHLSGILNKELKILVCCMNLNNGNLMNLFGIDNAELNLEDIVNFKMHPDNKAFDLINAIARNDNMFFIGSRKTSITFASHNMKVYEDLLEELKQSFDLVLIDTVSGDDNILTNMVIEQSDHVLNVIVQDKEALDENTFVKEKDIACIINMYRDIYPDVKELASIYSLKNLFILPCCDELQEMKNRGKLELYVQHDTGYNSSVKDLSCFLAKNLKLPLDKDAMVKQKRKTLFGGILGGLK